MPCTTPRRNGECYDAAISLLLYLGHTKEFVGLHYDGCTKAPNDFGRLEPDSDAVREYIADADADALPALD